MEQMAARREQELVPGLALGCRQGRKAADVREKRTVDLKLKLNEKDTESGNDDALYPF